MNTSNETVPRRILLPILFGFFVMGFVDIVGIATNYVKEDFYLSSTYANLLPIMVFIWFALCSIPTGILMGKIGKKYTVVISLAITVVAMLMPLLSYSFANLLVRVCPARYKQHDPASLAQPADCRRCVCR